MKKLSPFDFFQSISLSKKDIIQGEPENEKAYNSFVVNRTLSYFPDTALIANEMNRYHHLDEKLQYHFLLNIVRKQKRFSKWVKADTHNDIDNVKEYYGYSDEKARTVLPLLTPQQLEHIKNKVDKGGRRK